MTNVATERRTRTARDNTAVLLIDRQASLFTYGRGIGAADFKHRAVGSADAAQVLASPILAPTTAWESIRKATFCQRAQRRLRLTSCSRPTAKPAWRLPRTKVSPEDKCDGNLH